jgi:hypothetical protein
MDGFCFGAGIWSVKLASLSQQSNEHAAHEEYLLYFLRRIPSNVKFFQFRFHVFSLRIFLISMYLSRCWLLYTETHIYICVHSRYGYIYIYMDIDMKRQEGYSSSSSSCRTRLQVGIWRGEASVESIV